jgi:hypothetical protein
MTNKIALRSVEEFMQGYTPTFMPLYPTFMGRAQAYPAEVGENSFKRIDTIGDIRAKRITPKDTVLQQVASAEGSKTFKKYFFANQYINSKLQDTKGIEDVIGQVLDEHQKQQDDLFLLGEGTSNSTMTNNGLYWSSDANYRLENSIEVDKGTAADHLKDLHTQIMTGSRVVNQIAGSKVLVLYGDTLLSKADGLYANSDAAFLARLKESLGANYSVVKMPSAVTPATANGWIHIALDQIKIHYTLLPQLWGQGVNEEKMYSWHNFILGSMMTEVLVDDAIYRQPCTFEA